jgi:hypothetical protein
MPCNGMTHRHKLTLTHRGLCSIHGSQDNLNVFAVVTAANSFGVNVIKPSCLRCQRKSSQSALELLFRQFVLKI